MTKPIVKSALTRISKNKHLYNLPPLTGREVLELVKMQCPITNINFEDMFGYQLSMHELDTVLEELIKLN